MTFKTVANARVQLQASRSPRARRFAWTAKPSSFHHEAARACQLQRTLDSSLAIRASNPRRPIARRNPKDCNRLMLTLRQGQHALPLVTHNAEHDLPASIEHRILERTVGPLGDGIREQTLTEVLPEHSYAPFCQAPALCRPDERLTCEGCHVRPIDGWELIRRQRLLHRSDSWPRMTFQPKQLERHLLSAVLATPIQELPRLLRTKVVRNNEPALERCHGVLLSNARVQVRASRLRQEARCPLVSGADELPS